MPGTGLNLQNLPAANLANTCLRQSRELNDLLLEIQRLDSADDHEAAKKIIGKIMGEI
jgi:hypothetical protein